MVTVRAAWRSTATLGRAFAAAQVAAMLRGVADDARAAAAAGALRERHVGGVDPDVARRLAGMCEAFADGFGEAAALAAGVFERSGEKWGAAAMNADDLVLFLDDGTGRTGPREWVAEGADGAAADDIAAMNAAAVARLGPAPEWSADEWARVEVALAAAARESRTTDRPGGAAAGAELASIAREQSLLAGHGRWEPDDRVCEAGDKPRLHAERWLAALADGLEAGYARGRGREVADGAA